MTINALGGGSIKLQVNPLFPTIQHRRIRILKYMLIQVLTKHLEKYFEGN